MWKRLLGEARPPQAAPRDPHRFPRIPSAPGARAETPERSRTSILSARNSGPGGRGAPTWCAADSCAGCAFFRLNRIGTARAACPRISSGIRWWETSPPSERARNLPRNPGWTPQNRSSRCCREAAREKSRTTCHTLVQACRLIGRTRRPVRPGAGAGDEQVPDRRLSSAGRADASRGGRHLRCSGRGGSGDCFERHRDGRSGIDGRADDRGLSPRAAHGGHRALAGAHSHVCHGESDRRKTRRRPSWCRRISLRSEWRGRPSACSIRPRPARKCVEDWPKSAKSWALPAQSTAPPTSSRPCCKSAVTNASARLEDIPGDAPHARLKAGATTAEIAAGQWISQLQRGQFHGLLSIGLRSRQNANAGPREAGNSVARIGILLIRSIPVEFRKAPETHVQAPTHSSLLAALTGLLASGFAQSPGQPQGPGRPWPRCKPRLLPRFARPTMKFALRWMPSAR